MIAKVSERGQVVIPKRIRDRLGIRAGQRLEFREERGRLVATKAKGEEDPIDAVYGILRTKRSSDTIVPRAARRAGRDMITAVDTHVLLDVVRSVIAPGGEQAM